MQDAMGEMKEGVVPSCQEMVEERSGEEDLEEDEGWGRRWK